MTAMSPQDVVEQLRRKLSPTETELLLLTTYAERLHVSQAWWRDTADGMIRLALITELGIAREKGDVEDRIRYHADMVGKDRARLAAEGQAVEATWVTVRGKKVWV